MNTPDSSTDKLADSYRPGEYLLYIVPQANLARFLAQFDPREYILNAYNIPDTTKGMEDWSKEHYVPVWLHYREPDGRNAATVSSTAKFLASISPNRTKIESFGITNTSITLDLDDKGIASEHVYSPGAKKWTVELVRSTRTETAAVLK